MTLDSGDYNDPATIGAVLTDTTANPPAPVSGAPLTLSIGTQTCSATTDATGKGSCTVTPNVPAGTYPLTATFKGDTKYKTSSASGTFTVNREETALAITSTNALATGSVVVKARLQEDGSQPISGRTVSFHAGGVAGSGTTDSSGVATATLSLSPGSYTLTADFAGDTYYLSSEATAQTLTVYQPTQFVIWGGNAPNLADAVKVGQDFTFWGAQWAKQVTGGDFRANNSFKGYADTVTGTTWTSRPGNSSNPPANVASYISVIVATQAAKNGSVESGNVAEIAVLKVDDPSGYEPNPGHPASGAVVAILPAPNP